MAKYIRLIRNLT